MHPPANLIAGETMSAKSTVTLTPWEREALKYVVNRTLNNPEQVLYQHERERFKNLLEKIT